MSTDDDTQIGYQALPKGVPVITSDGIRIGEVAQVLDNAREHIFDGIVVKTDSRSVFVDAPEVARISLRQVTLTINASEADALPDARNTGGATANSLKPRHWWQRFGR